MNTLLFTLEYPPFKGGVANYYGNLVKYWPHAASFVSGHQIDNSTENLKVLYNGDGALLSYWLWPHWLPALFLLKKAIKTQAIEHIIVGHILPLGTVAYYVTRKMGISYSVFLHGMDIAYAVKSKRKKKLSNRILSGARSIICANSYTAELTHKYFPQIANSKIFVVNPGIASRPKSNGEVLSKLKKQYNLENKIILFSVGRLVKRKGFLQVIEAMKQLKKNEPDIHYFIAGEGPEKIKILKSSMREKNITFLGRIDDEERNAWFDLCDMFIMPATNLAGDFEGFGIVYLEANLAGKPVIAGRSGGVGDAVEDGLNGVLVNPSEVSEIAEAIKKLSHDGSLRIKLGEAGKKRVFEKFSWSGQVEKIYRLVNS